MTRTIDITPTWREAAQIIALALENGTGKGRDAARAELFRMADLLDKMNKAQQADAASKYTVAAYGDNQLTTGYYRTTSQPEWTTDHASADRMTKADAERIADDWNSYASSKGYSRRYRAEPAASTAEKAK